MTLMATRQKAANLIEERGWWQGYFFGPKGELCGEAALLLAVGMTPPFDDAPSRPEDVEDILEELEEEIDTGEAFFFWQDQPERTAAEVVAALRGQQS